MRFLGGSEPGNAGFGYGPEDGCCWGGARPMLLPPQRAPGGAVSPSSPRQTASRLEAALSPLMEELGPRRQPEVLALMRLHLDVVCLCLALERTELFTAHVGWLVPLLRREGVDEQQVMQGLAQLARGVQPLLPSEDAARIVPLLEQAISAYAPIEDPDWRALLTALLSGKLPQAEAIAQSALKHGHRYVYEELIQPALEEVGTLWSEGRISVADEHLATTLARTVVASFYTRFPWPRGGPRAVLACAEGEQHDFGLQLLSDMLALEGWQVVNFGANTPTTDLVRKIEQLLPVCVGLSFATPEALPQGRQMIAQLRARQPGLKIIVGGQALKALGVDGTELGADAAARTASQGLEVFRTWRATLER